MSENLSHNREKRVTNPSHARLWDRFEGLHRLTYFSRLEFAMIQLLIVSLVLACQQTAPATNPAAGPLVHEGIVAAPIEQVWAAFTTRGGLESWMAPHAEIDLRVGGKMRTNYNAQGTIGDSETIENTILSLEPLRMLSIKATKPPESFPFKNSIGSMWSLIYFDSAGPAQTKLRIVGLGYDGSTESQQLRAFFDRGNAYTLRKIQDKFAPQPALAATNKPAIDDAEQVLAHLAKFVGGEWISENKSPDGGVFRVRNHMIVGPDGKSLVTRGWLGGADGMHEHSAAQIWRVRNPDNSVTIRFQNIDESGSIARGEIHMLDERTSEWSWISNSLGGTIAHFRVNMILESDDSYRLRIIALSPTDSKTPDTTEREMVNVRFQRVAAVPAEFLKMRASAR